MGAKPPHWDFSRLFPSLESAEFGKAFEGIVREIGELRGLYDKHDVRKQERTPHATVSRGDLKDEPQVDEQTVAAVEEVTRRTNETFERVRTIYAYVSSFVTTDSRNDLAQGKLSELQGHTVELRKLDTRYDAWIGSLEVERLIERSAVAAEHAFPLRKAARSAQHLMSEAEEDLAASLNLSSGTQWAKLHGNVSSQLMVAVAFPPSAGGDRAGKTVELPMSAVRGLAHEADRATRKAAYEAELKWWERVAVPLAAAMNGIKGEVRTLNGRRKWEDDLEPMLFVNNIDRATLEAMHEACRESFADWRRYLKAKARLISPRDHVARGPQERGIGQEQPSTGAAGAQGVRGRGEVGLPWYDLFAPVGYTGTEGGGEGARTWSFDEAAEFVVEQFGTYSERLAELARQALRERWIDAEPRDGKRDGAFCMGVRKDESGVFLNFEPSFYSVSTLAHELGHAYHNTCLAARTPMQRETPMALAETASIFCQTIITNAALARADQAERLAILEHELQDGCQVVVDIHSRFLFEQRVFERRAKRELSVNELSELMLAAQKETYGDGLDEGAMHQYMWAMKPHYYSTGQSYYNWPYTFGQLFGQGLYARYREDSEKFRTGYDELLSSTGLHSAHDLGKRFGIDFSSVEFWRGSLDVNREQIRAFEALVGGGAAAGGAGG